MVLRQRILKEEIIKFIIVMACVLAPAFAIGVIVIVRNDNANLFLVFVLVAYLPILIPTLVLGLYYLEWYDIYNDRIEAKWLFGIKNKVYYANLLFVEETEIPLTSRGTYKNFFIFHDGRKNSGNLFGRNSCYNRIKYNLRIYVTPELENHIVNTLCLEIQRDLDYTEECSE